MPHPPTVPWPVLADTYLDAVERGLQPGVECRVKFGLTVKQWENRRAWMSKYKWLPPGLITDVPAAREVLRRKMKEVAASPTQLRRDAEAAQLAKRAKKREEQQKLGREILEPWAAGRPYNKHPTLPLRVRRTGPANSPAQRSPVLDLFF